MANQIVTVTVSQQIAPTPNKLQQTGAAVSQGATTLPPGSISLLTQLSDLTPLLSASVPISSISWLGGVATVTTTMPHGIPSGDSLLVVISGCTPIGYNGTVTATYVSANQFRYPLASNPGVLITTGSMILEDSQELLAMATTFFAAGLGISVYVIELGAGTPAEGVTALTAYINVPSVQMYRYLLPYTWSSEPTALSLAAAHSGTTGMLYFHPTVDWTNYTSWMIKSAFATIQTPTAPVLESDSAAMFAQALSYNPSAATQAKPFEYTFLTDVTPYKLTGPQQTALNAAGTNWVGTGAQGGISNTLVQNGRTGDLRAFNYWFSVDWVNVNVTLAVANAVINGSNSPTHPLFYNQAGINTLQAAAQAVMNNGVAFGVVFSSATNPVTVQAIPFVTYVKQNPGDYPLGLYKGLSITFTPQLGFDQIVIPITVTDFPQV